MENEQSPIPTFDPTKFEIKDRDFMVGSMRFYLPEIDKYVRIDCDNESASIYAIGGNLDNQDDALVYQVTFENELPDDAGQWLAMIKETLAYTIESEIAYFCAGNVVSLPAVWLPDRIRERADSGYLDSLIKDGKKVCIYKDDDADNAEWKFE